MIRREPRLSAKAVPIPSGRSIIAVDGEGALRACEIMDGREAARDQVDRRLETEFPALVAELREMAEAASITQLAGLSGKIAREVSGKIDAWVANQRDRLRRSAAEVLLDHDDADDPELRLRWSEAVEIGAGLMVSVAPLAAIPLVVGAAATTVTTFLVVPTATISTPILALGTAGIGGALLLSDRARRHGNDRVRRAWFARVEKIARKRVLDGPQSLRSVLMDEIDLVAQARLEEVE